MHRTAHGVAFQVRVVQGFGEDTLARECAVAMNQKWKVLFRTTGADAILLGTGTAHGDWIHGF